MAAVHPEPPAGSPEQEHAGEPEARVASDGDGLYHERQPFLTECCGVHTINNLLQLRPDNPGHLRKAAADSIAAQLYSEDLKEGRAKRWCPCTWLSECCVNPYRSMLGNYDIEVLIEALRRLGCCIDGMWVVYSDDVDSPDCLKVFRDDVVARGGKFCGLIVNRKARYSSGRHWYCLAPHGQDGSWVCHDSSLREPAGLAADPVASAVDALLLHFTTLLRQQQRAARMRSCLGFWQASANPLYIFAVLRVPAE